MFVIARFRARAGRSVELGHAIAAVAGPAAAEEGCLRFAAFRSVADDGIFFIHSRWRDTASFDAHAGLAHTIAFLARVDELVDEAPDIDRLVELSGLWAPHSSVADRR